MNDKKNIDRLFQERFKDFEVLPDDKIWNNIHDALHEKKKKRILPLWWKISGIAAGFMLAFLAFQNFSNSLETTPTVVVAPNEIKRVNENNDLPTNETKIAVETKNTGVEERNSNTNKVNEHKPTETRIASENAPSMTYEAEPRTSEKKRNNYSEHDKSTLQTASSGRKRAKIITKNAVVKNANQNKKSELSSKNKYLKEEVASNSSTEKTSEKSEFTTQGFSKTADNVASASEKSTTKNSNIETFKEIDSTTLAPETNPLEEILQKKKEKKEALAVAKTDRWQVTTNVAPVYFNSASNGSPIENQFAENSKSYENNLSVGVGVQYAVNKKLALRTGVNKVTLGYGTNDVVFFGALNSPGFNTLNSDNFNTNVEVLSSNNLDAIKPFEDNLQNMESGVLNQRMGYYEVPLELSFAVVNRKFGVHLIGGFSTLFLNENSVSVQSPNATLSLGKANNLNEVHFSSNIGLGLKYGFWKSFEAHFAPTFKYQFNTFSRDAGNFKPYFVGLYTGISFKF